MLRYVLCRRPPPNASPSTEEVKVIVTRDVIKETPKTIENVEKSSSEPNQLKKSTLLELSEQCEHLQDVSNKYQTSSDVNVDEVFVFGHKQCSVIKI